ncbi:MAG: hypothetical protein MUC51_11335 [Anaerolineae bacterium]|nr:hypothetical protein [Anaerolineae bacterium]
MANLIALVLVDNSLCDEIVAAWEHAGVPGLTILESCGIRHGHHGQAARDDLPIFPSLRGLLAGDEINHRIIFSVVPDGFDVDALINHTEAITGELDAPDNGFLFVMPVTRVRGRL